MKLFLIIILILIKIICLKKRFRHLSLFSICLHFLRCFKSCEKVWCAPAHCKICSRVRYYDFLECNASGNLMISFSSEILDLTSNHGVDLDVFLCNAEVNIRSYTKDNCKCFFFF